MIDPSSQDGTIEAWITGRIADLLGESADAIDAEAPLAELGIGSIDLVQIVADLEDRLQRPLDPSLLRDYRTIRALGAYLES